MTGFFEAPSHTFVYKTEPVETKCRVWLPESTSQKKAPVLVYWHGGCLVVGGTLAWVPKWLCDDARKAGFIIVSPEYRLLKPTTAHEVREDCIDFMKWIQTDLNKEISKLGSQSADTDKVVVTGSSAGGYLTSFAALYSSPKPKGLCYIYPMSGDFLLDFWVTRKTEVWISGEPLVEDKGQFKDLESSQTVLTENDFNDSKDPRNDYAGWIIQEGVYLDAVTGIDGLGKKLKEVPYEKRESVLPEEAKVLFPQIAIAETKDFPASIMVYATDDGLVPMEEGFNFEKVLKKNGVDVELLEFKGRDHAFDHDPLTDEEQAKLDKVVPFLLKSLEI